jgi:hypothetical protein
VDQRSATTIAIRGQQPARLPRAQPQNRRRRNLSTSPCQNFGKNLYALQLVALSDIESITYNQY